MQRRSAPTFEATALPSDAAIAGLSSKLSLSAPETIVGGGEKVGHGSGSELLLLGALKGSQWLA